MFLSYDLIKKYKLKDKFKIVNDNNITLKITRIIYEPEKIFDKKININQKLKKIYNEIKKYKWEDIMCID